MNKLEAEVTFGKSLLNRGDIQRHWLLVEVLNLIIKFKKPVTTRKRHGGKWSQFRGEPTVSPGSFRRVVTKGELITKLQPLQVNDFVIIPQWKDKILRMQSVLDIGTPWQTGNRGLI